MYIIKCFCSERVPVSGPIYDYTIMITRGHGVVTSRLINCMLSSLSISQELRGDSFLGASTIFNFQNMDCCFMCGTGMTHNTENEGEHFCIIHLNYKHFCV